MKLTVNSKGYEVEFQPDGVAVGGTCFKTTVLRDNGSATVRVNGRPYKVTLKDDKTVVVDGRSFTVDMSGRAAVTRQAVKVVKGPEKGAVPAVMPGRVLSLRVHEGDHVAAGAVLLILEAMKMENEIKAPHEGVVQRISVCPGQAVNRGDVMVVIE